MTYHNIQRTRPRRNKPPRVKVEGNVRSLLVDCRSNKLAHSTLKPSEVLSLEDRAQHLRGDLLENPFSKLVVETGSLKVEFGGTASGIDSERI